MIKIIQGSDKDILVRIVSSVTKDPFDLNDVDEIRACFRRMGIGGSVYAYLLMRMGNTTAGSDIVTGINTTGIIEGDPIIGSGITEGCVVLKTPTSTISPTAAGTIQISSPASLTATNVDLSIGVITIMSAILGKIKISLNEVMTESLEVGEGQGFEIRIIKGDRTSYVQFPESLNIVERLC